MDEGVTSERLCGNGFVAHCSVRTARTLTRLPLEVTIVVMDTPELRHTVRSDARGNSGHRFSTCELKAVVFVCTALE